MSYLLNPGDPAPDFSTFNHKGETVKLSDFRGKKVALYFYPEDDTPTCTAQACSLRDGYGDLKSAGYEVLGISPDSVNDHVKFRKKFDLPFMLLTDEDRQIAEKYGVWAEKVMFGHRYMGILRHTFVIDENGVIVKIIRKVRSTDHAAQILGH